MKKTILMFTIFALILTLALTACAKDQQNPQTDAPQTAGESDKATDGVQSQKTLVTFFPSSDKGKTEFNASVYEIEHFGISLVFPAGWTLKEANVPVEGETGFHYLYNSAFGITDIYNENGECVGAVGYNTYEKYEGEEDNPQAVYAQIALGNLYHFDVREAYNEIKKENATCSAITDVIYAENFLEELGVDINEKVTQGKIVFNEEDGYYTGKGILSYNSEKEVYVALEFDCNALSEEQFSQAAKSIEFTF